MRERLQKVIARAGIASRRNAEQLIRDGKVRVNGRTVTELGTTVDPSKDFVRVEGKVIRPEPFEYHAVHKPRSVMCAVSDPRGRRLVTDLVRSTRRIVPAGRLDYDSEGLVILTNDGELVHTLTTAGKVSKKYRVKVRGKPNDQDLARLRKGARVGGEVFASCGIKLLKEGNNCWYEVILRQGRNRQIRRMFESINHPVMRLKRVEIGPIKLGRMRIGETRQLTPSEVAALKSPEK